MIVSRTKTASYHSRPPHAQSTKPLPTTPDRLTHKTRFLPLPTASRTKSGSYHSQSPHAQRVVCIKSHVTYARRSGIPDRLAKIPLPCRARLPSSTSAHTDRGKASNTIIDHERLSCVVEMNEQGKRAVQADLDLSFDPWDPQITR